MKEPVDAHLLFTSDLFLPSLSQKLFQCDPSTLDPCRLPFGRTREASTVSSAEPLCLQPNRLLININRNIAHGKLVIHLALSALSDGIKHMNVILYSKPGCHLCEGMQEKLSAVQSFWPFELEIRDILTNPEWFERYQYTIPVIQVGNKILPPQPPHIPVQQLQRLLVRMTDAAKGTTP